MRIGNMTQIQQMYNLTATSKTTSTQKKGYSDAVSISSMGKDIQTAKAAVADAPDFRSDLVSSLKSQIDAGTYDVSGDDFADKLMERAAL